MTEPPPEVPKNELTPSTSVVSHAGLRGYPVLVNIQYPFMEPIGALRYMETPSEHGSLTPPDLTHTNHLVPEPVDTLQLPRIGC